MKKTHWFNDNHFGACYGEIIQPETHNYIYFDCANEENRAFWNEIFKIRFPKKDINFAWQNDTSIIAKNFSKKVYDFAFNVCDKLNEPALEYFEAKQTLNYIEQEIAFLNKIISVGVPFQPKIDLINNVRTKKIGMLLEVFDIFQDNTIVTKFEFNY